MRPGLAGASDKAPPGWRRTHRMSMGAPSNPTIVGFPPGASKAAVGPPQVFSTTRLITAGEWRGTGKIGLLPPTPDPHSVAHGTHFTHRTSVRAQPFLVTVVPSRVCCW